MLAKDPRVEVGRAGQMEQVHALAVVLREEFGIAFLFYDASTGELLHAQETTPGDHPSVEWKREIIGELAKSGQAQVQAIAPGYYELALPIFEANRPLLLAVGVLSGLARNAAETAGEQARLQKWLLLVGERLRTTTSPVRRSRNDKRPDLQAVLPWEAILMLGQVTSHIRIHRESSRNKRSILHAAGELLRAETMVWVPEQRDGEVVLEGEPLLSSWDCRQLASFLAQASGWDKGGFLLCNRVQETGWGNRFPRINDLLILATEGVAGWVVALNKKARKETTDEAASSPTPGEPLSFRRSEAALLTPFAALLGLHLRASRRYQDLKDLLVGLTRSLTAAIDAKDSYTYGHSERVARIAVELGRELGLPDDELSDIYLAGLLHDIGKIGIRDSVLCKRDPLTSEEIAHLREHVTIGYQILGGLNPIKHLLPGVLYHHERYDGNGYPEGLQGEAIPFLARILAVADSYDAMSTTRPYRAAMPRAKVEEILTQGAGTQWDSQVLLAFHRCRERIFEIRQRGLGESLGLALDGALRNGNQGQGSSSIGVHVLGTKNLRSEGIRDRRGEARLEIREDLGSLGPES